jgi:hypothetical protein
MFVPGKYRPKADSRVRSRSELHRTAKQLSPVIAGLWSNYQISQDVLDGLMAEREGFSTFGIFPSKKH